MGAAMRFAGVVCVLVLSIACGGSAPTVPSAVGQPSPTVSSVPRPPTTNFPPPSGPSRLFAFDHGATTVQDYTKHSRFVLYDNGAFVLEYLSLNGQYRGGWTESNGVITFEWEGWSVAGPWAATAKLENGLLDVKYNDVMYWTDFEDAVYRLTPP